MPELPTPFKHGIWDEFGEQSLHRRMKKAPYLMSNYNFFGVHNADVMHILVETLDIILIFCN